MRWLNDVRKGKIRATARDRLEAAKILLGYGIGRPVETHVLAGASGEAREAATEIADAQLLELAQGLKSPANLTIEGTVTSHTIEDAPANVPIPADLPDSAE